MHGQMCYFEPGFTMFHRGWSNEIFLAVLKMMVEGKLSLFVGAFDPVPQLSLSSLFDCRSVTVYSSCCTSTQAATINAGHGKFGNN